MKLEVENLRVRVTYVEKETGDVTLACLARNRDQNNFHVTQVTCLNALLSLVYQAYVKQRRKGLGIPTLQSRIDCCQVISYRTSHNNSGCKHPGMAWLLLTVSPPWVPELIETYE